MEHPSDIHAVCLDWNENGNRDDFIINLFDVYLDRLSLKNFKAIYTFLEYTADRRNDPNADTNSREINLNNTEFVNFVLLFAQRLLKNGRYA